MKQQVQPAQFGLWMRAPLPPRRNERGQGWHVSKKGSFFPEQTGVAASKTGPAARGVFPGDGGGAGESSPNPKRSKLHKESSGEDGVNYGGDGLKHGGVVSSYLAKINMETDTFQNVSRNGKKGGKGKVTERKKSVSKETWDDGALNTCRFSPNNKSTCLADEVERKNRWDRNQARGIFISSPTKNKSPKIYYGPVVADVERNIQSDKKKADNSKSRDVKFLANGLETQNMGEIGGISMSESLLITSRKRELNGDVKIGGLGNELQHSQIKMQIGSGMAAAAEQPRRPQ
jgi:hypothetical protein